ncbi:unknown [Eggerthella sp. CAG:298]|nr:unknown [Eggerthella sp. CAG:298]
MKLIVGFLRFRENDQRFIGSFLIGLLCFEDLVPTLLQDAQIIHRKFQAVFLIFRIELFEGDRLLRLALERL